MGTCNQRGQILIESAFTILVMASLLILFQIMIDKQRKESTEYRLSKAKKDTFYVEKNENIKSK